MLTIYSSGNGGQLAIINNVIMILLVVACLIGLTQCNHEHAYTNQSTVSVGAQSVVCCPDIDCSNENVIGVMSARKCCLDSPNGLAYRIPGQEITTVCIGEYRKQLEYQSACM